MKNWKEGLKYKTFENTTKEQKDKEDSSREMMN